MRERSLIVHGRDHDYETSWLEAVEREAGVDAGFQVRVWQRLQWAQHKYGDEWTRRRLSAMFHEIGEEALDLGGWPVLCAQLVIDVDRAGGTLHEGEAIRLLGLLRQIAVLGAQVDELVQQAGQIIGDR